MKAKHTYTALQWVLRLMPLLVLAVLFIPGLSPAAFFPFIKDWSYTHLLGHAMEVDQLFTQLYPGVREMFAYTALIVFCNYALLFCLGGMVVGSLISLVKKPKVRQLGFKILTVCCVILLAVCLLAIFRIASANGKIAQLGYDEMGMQYLFPAGFFALAAVGLAGFLLFMWYRRLWMVREKLYMPMTKNERRENLKGYAFISPYLIGFAFFTAFPLLFSFFSSFTYYNITAMQKWYGVTNFVNMFTKDPLFWKSLGNTLYYVVFSVPLVIIVAMILALLMNMRTPGMYFFRTVYYLPSVLSGVAVFLLWQWIFDPSSGLLNNALALFGIKGPAWLYDAKWTKPAMIIMRLWSTGGTMILLLAALQGVPTELYEAGSIEGAVGWRKFFHITLPMISPTLFFILVTNISGAFQVYDAAYIMVENGGPDKSLNFYNLLIFNTAFKDQAMGKASSMAWVLFIIIMGLTIIQSVGSKKWVHYEGGTDK